MKILLLSDNHGNWSTVNEIILNFRDQVDYIFHCGDSEFSSDDPIWSQINGVVKGNMDFNVHYPELQFIDTEVGKILLSHGHLQHINNGPQGLLNLAKKNKASMIFYGHTHILSADIIEGCLMVNPGSIKQSRAEHSYRTFAVLEFTQDKIITDFYSISQVKIEEFSKVLSREQVIG